jgi:hypothetical protein
MEPECSLPYSQELSSGKLYVLEKKIHAESLTISLRSEVIKEGEASISEDYAWLLDNK